MEQNNPLQGSRTDSTIRRNRQAQIQLGNPPRAERNTHGLSIGGYNLRSNARNRRRSANSPRQNSNGTRPDTRNRRQGENDLIQPANDITRLENELRQREAYLRQATDDFIQNANNRRQLVNDLRQSFNYRRQIVQPLRIRRLVSRRRRNPYTRGLTSERIGRFQHFDADQSMVGDRCIICMSDLEVGTKMVRLDCHVDHYLCKTCTDGWFKDHRTCPTCRHAFN